MKASASDVKRALGLAALFAAAALAIYAPSFGGGFVSDDFLYVERNDVLRMPALAAMVRVFQEPYFAVGNWAPLHIGFLWTEWRLFGDSPAGWRVTNALLHAACALAMTALARRAGASRAGALATGALLLAHPAAVEAVAWINQSKTLLSLLLALLALERWLAHLERPGGRRLEAAFGLALLAMLAKSAVVLLPGVFAAAWWTHGAGRRRDAGSLGILALAAGYVLLINLRAQAAQGGVVAWFGGSPFATALVLPWVLWRYVRMAYLPFDPTTCVRPEPIGSALDPRLLLPLAGVLVFAALVGLAIRRDRRFGLAAAWIVAMLLPVVQLVPMTTVYADRYLATALPGFLVLAAEPAARLATRSRVACRTAALLGALLLLAFGARSAAQARLWADTERLYEQTVAAFPESGQGWTGLAAERHRRGALDAAAEGYLRALALDPKDGHARHLLARVRVTQGREAEALYDLETSLRLAPEHYDVAWTRATAAALRAKGVTPVPDDPR